MVNSVITSIKIRWEDIASDNWLRQIRRCMIWIILPCPEG